MEAEAAATSPKPTTVGRKTITPGGRSKKITQNMDQALMADNDDDLSIVNLEQEVDETVAEEMRLKAIEVLEAEIKEEQANMAKEVLKVKEKEAAQKKVGILIKKLKIKKKANPKSPSSKGRLTAVQAINNMKNLKPLGSGRLNEKDPEPPKKEEGKTKSSERKPTPTPMLEPTPVPSTPETTAAETKTLLPPPRPSKSKPKPLIPEKPKESVQEAKEPVQEDPTPAQRAAGVGVTSDQLTEEESKYRRLSMNIGLDAYSKAAQVKGVSPAKKKKKIKLGKRSGNADARLQMNAANNEELDVSIFGGGGSSEEEVTHAPIETSTSSPSASPKSSLPKQPKRKTNRAGKKKITGNKDARLMDKTLNRKKEATIHDLGIEEVADERELARRKAAALAGVGKKTEDLTIEELAARRASKNIGMDAYRTTKVIGGVKGTIIDKKKKKKRKNNADARLLAQSNNRDSLPPSQQPQQFDLDNPPPLPPRKSELLEIEAVIDEI